MGTVQQANCDNPVLVVPSSSLPDRGGDEGCGRHHGSHQAAGQGLVAESETFSAGKIWRLGSLSWTHPSFANILCSRIHSRTRQWLQTNCLQGHFEFLFLQS